MLPPLDILSDRDISLLGFPVIVSKLEFRYPKSFRYLLPVLLRLYFPLQRFIQAGGYNIGHPLLVKKIDELPDVKSTISNNSPYRDVPIDPVIGRFEKSKDVIPRCNIAGTVPEIYHILAPVQKSQQRTMASSPLLLRVITLPHSFLLAISLYDCGIKGHPVFSDLLPRNKPRKISPYPLRKSFYFLHRPHLPE